MSGLVCIKSMNPCPTPGMCSPHGGCQPDKGFSPEYLDLGVFVDWVWNLKAERDQLKAENACSREREIHQLAEIEALRKALTYIRDSGDDWHICEKAADALVDSLKEPKP